MYMRQITESTGSLSITFPFPPGTQLDYTSQFSQVRCGHVTQSKTGELGQSIVNHTSRPDPHRTFCMILPSLFPELILNSQRIFRSCVIKMIELIYQYSSLNEYMKQKKPYCVFKIHRKLSKK